MKYVSWLAVLLLCMFSLYACGGGGGGNNPATGVAAQPIAITSANAQEVSGEILDVIGSTGDLGGLSGMVGLAKAQPAAENKRRGNLSVMAVAKTQLLKFVDTQARSASKVFIAEVAEEPLTCSSGSGTVMLNDADNNNELSAGDTFALTYNDCSDPDQMATMNGQISMAIRSVTGDPMSSTFGLSATFTFSNLQMTDEFSSTTISGSVTFEFDFDQTQFMASMTGNSLRVSDADDTITLSNFAFSQSIDEADLAFTMTAEGTLSSESWGGSVTFATVVAFEGAGDGNSSVGQILIRGDNSSVRVTAVNSADVRLEIDVDGDGVVDDTMDTTWQALEDGVGV